MVRADCRETVRYRDADVHVPAATASARTDKNVMLAASQVRAGAVVAIGIYEYDRPTPGSVRASVGKTKATAAEGAGPRRGCGGAPVHCALRSDVTAANMLTWEPVCSDDGPFHARIREAAALMLVRLAGTDGWKGTCSSEHEACCAAWVPRPPVTSCGHHAHSQLGC